MLKINFDKIIDGITKEIEKVAPESAGKTLSIRIQEDITQGQDKKQAQNVSSFIEDCTKKPKTSVPPSAKIPGATKRKITSNTQNSPKDEEIEVRFQDKEINPYQNLKEKIDPSGRKSKPSTEINVSGRRAIILNDSLFVNDRSKFLKNNSVSSNESFIADSLRGRAGKFWSLDEDKKNFSFVGNESSFQTKSPFIFDFRETLDDDEISDFGRTFQIAGIEADETYFFDATKKYNKSLWNSYVLGKKYNGSTKNESSIEFEYSPTIKEDTIYEDHAFDMILPMDESDVKELHGQVGTLVAEIEPVYNFLIEQYETTVSKKKGVLENTLPNMYVMLSEAHNEVSNPEFTKHISLGDAIKTDAKKILSFNFKTVPFANKSNVYDIKKNQTGEYFDLFGRYYPEVAKKKIIKLLDDKFSNLGVSIKDIPLFQNFNDKKHLFPLYVEIKFSTDKTTTFTQILKDTDLLDTFTSKIINKISTKSSDQTNTKQAVEEIFQASPNKNPKKSVKILDKTNRNWDISDLVRDIKESTEPLVKNAIYLGNYSNTQKATDGPEFKFIKSLNSEIFHSKLHSLVKQKMRSYEEMMDGQLAYNETVMYRIAKFIGDDIGKDPIQNIFIPNATELDVYTYVDTQVKYDKKYTYVVYAYQLVIGNKYWYSNVKSNAYDRHATFRIYQEPSLKLMEIPYYNFTGRVMDKPPAPPSVEFISYKGIDNKMLMFFNNNVMELKAQPVSIRTTDTKHFDKIKEGQRLKKGQPISFGGDDRISNYEIYRLDKKPTSYLDFANSLRINLNTDVSISTIQKASAGSVVDNIEPNKKFYYTFRAKDVHGHLSNPTSLYEVEMINEHGTIFPIVKIVDFKEKIEKKPSKTMKRFVQIIPTILQSLIDEEKSGFDKAQTADQIKDKVALSLADEKIWGKNFRIRLTSRLTGKKIEFDINFKHQTVNRVDKK